MKVQNINYNVSYAVSKRPNRQVSHINKEYDSISFTSKTEENKKSSFLENLKTRLSKRSIPQVACYTLRKNAENLSDDEIKSEQIKKFVGETIASYGGFNILGRENRKEILSMLRVGAENFYEGTILYNNRENKNITFSNINPKTDIPGEINVWEDGQFAYSYEIKQKEPLEYQVYIKADNLETTETGVEAKLTQFLQTDKRNSTIKVFDNTEVGFNYLYGFQDQEGQIQILKRLYFDFNDIDGCIYAEGTEEGIVLYFYNQDKDLWENKYLLEFEE